MKHIHIYIIMCVLGVFGLSACDDIDDFTTSPNNLLTFSTDTVRIDTVFSTVPSSMRDFWVSNRSGKGLRCTSVRLEGGNQNGFRVNVDGVYLSPEQGYKANYIEVRNKDSIRVFVEVTTAVNHGDGPKELNDCLVFALESGVEQKVVLNAWSWDADFVRNKTIDSDYTISAGKPLVVYGPLTVEEGATLTVAPGATLYFHDGAGIDVKGRLVCKGTADQPVTLRGDRLDHMFDYLPYDRMSGLWNGIHFLEKSYDNVMEFTDLHSAFHGVRVDSSDVARQTLTIANYTQLSGTCAVCRELEGDGRELATDERAQQLLGRGRRRRAGEQLHAGTVLSVRLQSCQCAQLLGSEASAAAVRLSQHAHHGLQRRRDDGRKAREGCYGRGCRRTERFQL